MKKKKSFIFIVAAFTISSCHERINDYYSGIVIDELNRPLAGVLVREDYLGHTENKTVTDKNGFFKFNRTGLPLLIFSKDGYLQDTIRIMWHQCGETTEYASLVKKDSSKVLLRAKNVGSLNFTYKKTEKPAFNSIENFTPGTKLLFATWLKNGNKDLEGFKIAEDGIYAFGFDGNRYMRFVIHADTITLYKDDYYYSMQGIIEKVDDKILVIQWQGKKTISYQKWQYFRNAKYTFMTNVVCDSFISFAGYALQHYE